MPRPSDPQPGIEAKYATDCPRCPEPIMPRDRVVYQRGLYIHCRCASGQDDQ